MPGRHYHNLSHIEACFKLYDEVVAACPNSASYAVELALWYHDIVYDTGRNDNEAYSALLFARTTLAQPEHSAPALRMIVISDHKSLPTTDADELFVDIDLSILGESPEVFDRYEVGIRKEYSFVPDDIYRLARGKIMSGFLERATSNTLFHTPVIQEKYGKQAIENLKLSIKRLG